ncbi:putative Fe-containing alcohol dehydrogenase [Mycena rosella]|uniref:Fe-containing alcohol dehydrogenase n=1 Tax=Mycena rosella TaxID=1033263 RepID=A0AAD7C6U8_MYCRO|nr:putative Fe-containing alcohol dehydrogenase [Mycena rosella]
MAITGEVYRQAFPNSAKPMLSYGIPLGEACRKHAEEYGVKKIYILASGTLSRNTNLLQGLKRALDGMVVGERIGMTPHTLVSEVIEVLHDVRQTAADCIVTLGGGSLSDAAKAITFAEANDVQTREDLLNLPHMMAKDRPSKPTRMPYILIPSTLSGGEYSSYSGVTDEQTNIKYQLCNLAPADVVILSGELAATTPGDVWIASGVRAIDHCCENLCTFKKEEPWAVVEKAQIDGLKLLVPNLLKTLEDPCDATARFNCQLGVVLSLFGLQYHVYPGCSHGIGHILGPMGVSHGKTSAVLMPAVHKYNASVNEKDQSLVRSTLWSILEAADLFQARGLQRNGADLGDLLDAVVRRLGMPRSLTEVGITGEEKLQQLARNSMADPCVHMNPRKIERPEHVLEILRMCT